MRAPSHILIIPAFVLCASCFAQDKMASFTIKIEATGQNCDAKPDTVYQFATKLADQAGLWTTYSAIASSQSIRIKGERSYGINLIITKVNLDADLCQLMPLADPANKSSFDKMFPFAKGLSLAGDIPLPDKLWYVALAGPNESFLAANTKRSSSYAKLSEVPIEATKAGKSTLPSYLKTERISNFMIIVDSSGSQQVIRRFVGGPVWGENWKKDGVLGLVGGVLPTKEPNTYIAWVVRGGEIADRMRYQSHSVIPVSTRDELKRMACISKLPAVEQDALQVVVPDVVKYEPMSQQMPLHDRMVIMLGRWREFRESPRSKEDADRLCHKGNLDISAAYTLTTNEQTAASENIGFGTLVPMMACIHEEYCRSKDKPQDRSREDFRSKVMEFNRRVDYLSGEEMEVLSEAGVGRPQLVEFAQELFVLSHHGQLIERAKADTSAAKRSLCKLRLLLDDLEDWRAISSRVADYPSSWRNQVEELELATRRLNRTMVDSLEAKLLRAPLDFEGTADEIERNECLSSEEAGLLVSRIMKAKQPKPQSKRAANIAHAETMKVNWASRVKSIAALERLPNWEFTYVSYEDSVVVGLRFSGGQAVEEVKGQVGNKKSPTAARACSYGFPLGSCIYPECIPAVELFATFVEENYYQTESGYGVAGLRITGSADNTPIRAKLNYPPEIIGDLQTVPDASNANVELAYARAFYARYILYDQTYQWPSMLAEFTTVTGIEVQERGEAHRNILLELVVTPKR